MVHPVVLYQYIIIQGGAEPTDTFQMVIDNVWKLKNKRIRL